MNESRGHDETSQHRPSWYTGSPGEQNAGSQWGAGSAAPTGGNYSSEHYRQPPSAADAGGYGVPSPGYVPAGYGYSRPAGQPPSPGYHRYSPTPGTDELDRMHDWQGQQARSAATTALVLGIIGFFTVPFIMGPLALWQASKARRVGYDATAGWVLGWICTIWGIAVIAMPFLLVIFTIFIAAI